uniref:Uncharacterized protein n=1 Tax=Trypanosoma congolense (strain IL3000) TaxID=1068625 RepID=G0URB3_TRYCI|nr:hypothetical protein TCIL3000_8_1420 [Trypanosoma congolense IL3000]
MVRCFRTFSSAWPPPHLIRFVRIPEGDQPTLASPLATFQPRPQLATYHLGCDCPSTEPDASDDKQKFGLLLPGRDDCGGWGAGKLKQESSSTLVSATTEWSQRCYGASAGTRSRPLFFFSVFALQRWHPPTRLSVGEHLRRGATRSEGRGGMETTKKGKRDRVNVKRQRENMMSY